MPSRAPIHRPAFYKSRPQQKKEAEKKRPSSHKRGYTRKWAEAREHYLIENPLCAECTKHDIVEAASEVDHIIPHKGDMELFWDRKNWQGLCKPCHSKKTMKEGRFG